MGRGGSFKGRQVTAAVVLWVVRWYLQLPISYRDLELLLQDRGVSVDQTTIVRWIQAYSVEPEMRLRHSAARFYRNRRAADPSPVFKRQPEMAQEAALPCPRPRK
jgi:transposase-like protein